MRFLLPILVGLFFCHPLTAQETGNGPEISTGVSVLVYQSVFSFRSDTAVETAGRWNLSGMVDWQAGVRLGFGNALPDGFLRLIAAPQIGSWRPFAGIELGYTNCARFEKGDLLLRETRTAMEENISHVYIAAHSAPLSFKVTDDWRLSMLEFHVGTHLGHTGRTVRIQAGLFSLGKTF